MPRKSVAYRICSKCKSLKALTEYYKDCRGQHRRKCKDCIRENKRMQYKQTDQKKKTVEKRWKSLGINFTYEQYEEMLDAQGHKCAICPATRNRNDTALCVDHCHKTGVVRGLLCHRCNKALGSMEDDKDLLLKAVDYLAKTGGT